MIADSGVAKSTFYVHFRTKDALIAAYLRRTDESWRGQLRTAAERAGDPGAGDPGAGDPDVAVEQLVGLFDALLDAFDRHGFFGCPFISAAVETALDSQARAITIEHTTQRQAWLAELAARAGAGDPAALGRQIGLLIDGTLASGRLLQQREVVEEAKAAARALIAVHTTGLPGSSGLPGTSDEQKPGARK